MADDGGSTNSSLTGCVPLSVTSRGPYPGPGPSLHNVWLIPNRLDLRGRKLTWKTKKKQMKATTRDARTP